MAIRSFVAIVAGLLGLLMAVPVVVVGLPFWIVASITHALARLIEPPFIPWQQFIEFAPSIGWKPKPNLDIYYLTNVRDDIFHLVTDSQGWPGKASIAESDVVVFGDSFAFGYGVDSKASFAELDPSLRIKAIGSPGYNMVQELLLMRQLCSQLKGKLVVWFICVDNDLIDNLMPDMNKYRTPFARRKNGEGDWEIVTSHISPAHWDHSANDRPYLAILAKLCSPSSFSQRAYSACEFLIQEGKEVCTQAGAQLVVMMIPNAKQMSQAGQQFLVSLGGDARSFDPDFPDRTIGGICAKLGIPFIAAKDFLGVSDYKEFDPHWNEEGHRRVAEMLRNLYRDYRMREDRSGRELATADRREAALGLATLSREKSYEA